MSARNNDDDGVRPNTLDGMQILESNSTLTETTYADVTPTKSHSPSPSATRNSGTHSIQPASSYVSSASSTTGVPSPFSSHLPQTKEVLQPKQLQYPPSPKPQMTTIENSSPRNSKSVRKDSDDAILNIQPVHPFFNQHPGWLAHYDSDGSNGSFVQKGRKSSADSLNSSGSIKYTSTTGPSPVKLHQNPRMLPYHERRKLMQQRQLQRNAHAAQSAKPSHPPISVDPRLMTPDLTVNANYQHNPPPQPFPSMDHATATAYANMYSILNIPYQPYPYNNFGYPVQGYSVLPPNGPQPPQQQQQYNHPNTQYSVPHLLPEAKQAPSTVQQNPFRANSKQNVSSHDRNRPPKAKILAPNGMPSPRPPVSAKHSFGTRGYFNSASASSQDSSTDPPPPPPPPHIHSDSLGSSSSFGSSTGRNPEHSGHRRDNSSGSFLEMLRAQWTPPQKSKPSVSEFHRSNQEFLNRTPSSRRPSPQRARHLHQRVPSEDRPPASRGTHKRLPSISNDIWDETPSGEVSGYSSSSDGKQKQALQQQQMFFHDNKSYKDNYYCDTNFDPNESTSLLPPTGISTNEKDGARRPSQRHDLKELPAIQGTSRMRHWDHQLPTTQHHSRKNRKKKHKRKHKSSRRLQQQIGDSEDSSESASNQEYLQWTQKRAKMLEKERAKLIAQWKAEAREEAEQSRHEMEQNLWYQTIKRSFHDCQSKLGMGLFRLVVGVETFVANLPLMIGAIAMAVVTLGVVWFKFAEENLESCEPVHFHSSQCTFPEFPGCFYCDTNATMYKVALRFHYGCSIFAGLLAMLFVLKIFFATRLVLDELSSPTTASPAGLLCMTIVSVFAGRSTIGQFMVTTAACAHMCLVLWFVYMILAYRTMPDPSWFPNTVGIGLTAVKTWLYYPTPGLFLMAVSLTANFFFFPISLVRVGVNKKISATVAWMQMCAPAISLYALTIMAQPSFAEEHPDVTRFQKIHRMIYLPCMHVMASLSLVGFLASCHSLWQRWEDFIKRDFSPAHAAFCFPVLSFANALQAYRGSILSFSSVHPRSWQMVVLYMFWVLVLLGGTISTIWITVKFLWCLPLWTNLDREGEVEPPAPNETIVAIREIVTAGETILQPFISPAILQANETGALVLARVGPEGDLQYVRTRRLPSLGFEPTMDWSEMQREREVLLDWVARHPPRRRHRTLSVPGLDFRYTRGIESSNAAVYGSTDWLADNGSMRTYF